MDSIVDEILHDFPGFVRIHKDGRCHRYTGTDIVPSGVDSSTGVQSKDVVISPETNLSARLYISKTTDQHKKIPVLIYFHGGGFIIESAASPTYHNYLNTLVAEANIVVVSVEYRRAPEFSLPVAYDDSWAVIEWVADKGTGDGQDQDTWLKSYGDFDRVFFAGDSAGGNIAHNMAIRVGLQKPVGINLVGIILIHPWFWGKDPIGEERDESKTGLRVFTDGLWMLVNPTSSGSDDPLINPEKDPNVAGLGCAKVLVCVAELDLLKDRGWYFKEVMVKSGYGGNVEVMESKGENHVFFLFNPSCENAIAMQKKVISFINEI